MPFVSYLVSMSFPGLYRFISHCVFHFVSYNSIFCMQRQSVRQSRHHVIILSTNAPAQKQLYCYLKKEKKSLPYGETKEGSGILTPPSLLLSSFYVIRISGKAIKPSQIFQVVCMQQHILLVHTENKAFYITGEF